MNLTIDDRRWLKQNYPKLNFTFEKDTEIIEGSFEFKASFDKETKQYIINPPIDNCKDLNYIEDAYQVRIILSNKESDFPIVQETAKRIKNLAYKLNKPLIDLHIYENGTGCIIGPYDESGDISIKNFINGPVLQFFYDQSFYEKFREWPRGTYSHGYLGLIENYFDNFNAGKKGLEQNCIERLMKNDQWSTIKKLCESDKDIKGHRQCLCGSKLKFRACHPEVFKGLLRLQKYYKMRAKI